MSDLSDVGHSWPGLEDGCPECGSNAFEGIELARTGVVLDYDGAGGISYMDWGDVIESFCTLLTCRKCDTTLIEDGEPVHEVLQ